MAISGNTSHPTLSYTDGIATTFGDLLLLVGRVFLGWLFLASGYGKLDSIAGTAGYFTSLGMSPPEFWAWFATVAELVLGAALILGMATRYSALASFVWTLVATAIAHRYWTYPVQEQADQYINWLKNIAIMGGTLYAFVAGAGRYSLDAMLAKR
ncbi:MAG TPA: DoxX family protein [Bradyrhizobium sp.]|jgi:Predicted membrane protein